MRTDQLKKLTLSAIVILAVIAFTSCDKDKDKPVKDDSYFSATLGNTHREFSGKIYAQRNEVMGHFYTSMGVEEINRTHISVSVAGAEPVKTGDVYVADTSNEYSGNYFLNYATNFDGRYYNESWSLANLSLAKRVISVNISELNDEFVEGTFSGTIYRTNSQERDSMQVTNGRFKARWIK